VHSSHALPFPEPRVQHVGTRGPRYYVLKRLLDVVLALILGLVALPIVIFAALAIRLDSPGPVLYKQIRVGSKRVRTPSGYTWQTFTFYLLKLRTMEDRADATLHREYIKAYIQSDESKLEESEEVKAEGSYKLVNDPRITRVGRYMRALSIDELPQLWNVIRGDMSLVGPRPPIDYEVEHYREGDLLRFASPQGLTGWWQVRGRATTGFDEMVADDLEYIERQSILFDLWIIMRTVPAILSRKGAG